MKKESVYFLIYGGRVFSFTLDEKILLDLQIEHVKNLGLDYKVYKQLDLFQEVL